jgi:hypothetical protein
VTVASGTTVQLHIKDGKELKWKDPGGGIRMLLPPMQEWFSAPPNPKLNLGVEVRAPGIVLVMVRVSKVPVLSRLSVVKGARKRDAAGDSFTG